MSLFQAASLCPQIFHEFFLFIHIFLKLRHMHRKTAKAAAVADQCQAQEFSVFFT